MINDEYFHGKFHHNDMFDNKYQTEIFNGNKIDECSSKNAEIKTISLIVKFPLFLLHFSYQ